MYERSSFAYKYTYLDINSGEWRQHNITQHEDRMLFLTRFQSTEVTISSLNLVGGEDIHGIVLHVFQGPT
jgi:hypothetical protein